MTKKFGRYEYCPRLGKRVAVRLYRIWTLMKHRCDQPNANGYERWGGKGVRVCKGWAEDYAVFRAWAITNGYAKDLTLDRIDGDGDYEPSNCRWVTRAEQQYNSPNTKHYTFNGETKPGPVLAKEHGLTPAQFRCRINSGWSVEDALTKPLQAQKSNVGATRKITDEQIRWLRSCGLPGSVAAERIGISPNYARRIISGAVYGDVQ